LLVEERKVKMSRERNLKKERKELKKRELKKKRLKKKEFVLMN